MSIPSTLISGDSLTWLTAAGVDTVTGLPIDSAAYTLATSFRGSGGSLDVTATTSGTEWSSTITAVQSAALPAGVYQWASYASKAGVRLTLYSGTITITANLAAANSTFEARSHNRKMLDAIEAMLESRATKEQQEYTIGTRSLKYIPILELLQLRESYKREVFNDQQAERLAKGMPTHNRLYVRMR
jgi:uncharacterized transporter YbjL